jgi:hypothetical protein
VREARYVSLIPRTILHSDSEHVVLLYMPRLWYYCTCLGYGTTVHASAMVLLYMPQVLVVVMLIPASGYGSYDIYLPQVMVAMLLW